MTDRDPRSVHWVERAGVVAVGLAVAVAGGLAALVTLSAAVGNDGPRTDRDYDHSLFVGFYVWGTICTALTVVTLAWLLPRWWKGRHEFTGSVITTASVIGVFVTCFLWLMNLGALISD